MVSEVEQMEMLAAQLENRKTTSWYLMTAESDERGQYAVPTANEVAVSYVREENDVPASRSLAVHLCQAAGSTLLNTNDID
ncbi:hypothetical protein NECAME_05255 [Necator americanus]|uniref:Uncharacterized protein n=1 Tax=Necator americanus TaxID=51031 RepID=W2SIJ6_NECAM|nr:hypothetical protein NECAME_05255 [Necator americanus]ETN69400.1 hypothetical protein NECAME_05255 [Necator americanus]